MPRPSLPELQSEAVKWQRRISMVASQGVSAAPITQLARTDLTRIMQGGSPLAEQQIVSMVHSAYTGQIQTPVPESHAEGILGKASHVVGNVVKDIGEDVKNFVPGLVHEGADIANPAKWGKLGTDLQDFKFGSISDMAKEVRALPIVGPLVPGTFALTAGWKGIEEHPLNFFLDVFATASAGSSIAFKAGMLGEAAEAGTALEALQHGHPMRAIAKETGLEDKLMQSIANSKIPAIAQYAHMPVWRAYNDLVRVYQRRLVTEVLTELHDAGLITDTMSFEQQQHTVLEALSYDPRFEKAARRVDPDAVKAAGSDLHTAFAGIPADEDIIAYTTDAVRPIIAEADQAATAVYFSPDDAKAHLPEGVDEKVVPVVPVRVKPGNITYANGQYMAKGVVPNKNISPEHAVYLKKVAAYVDKLRAKSLVKRSTILKSREAFNVALPTPHGTEIYAKNSKVVKVHKKYQAASKSVNMIQKEVSDLHRQVSNHRAVVGSRTQRFARYGESAKDTAERTPTLSTVDALYEAAQDYVIKGLDGPNKALFEKLDAAFRSGRARSVRVSLRQIIDKLRKDGGKPYDLAYTKYLHDATRHLGTKEISSVAAGRTLTVAELKLKDAQERLQTAKLHQLSNQKDFFDSINANPPDRAFPLLADQVKGELIQQAQNQYFKDAREVRNSTNAAGLSLSILEMRDVYRKLATDFRMRSERIKDSFSREELASSVGEKTLAKVEQNVFQDWAQMQAAGYDPIWVHQIDPGHYERRTWQQVRPLPDRAFEPHSERARVFDYSPQVLDMGAILTDAAVEYLRQEATYQFVDWMVTKSGIIHKASDVRADLMRRYRGDVALVNSHLRDPREWRQFNPHEYTTNYGKLPGNDAYLIPASVHQGFSRLMDGDRLPFKAARHKSHEVWKVAVLTGPRHMVHVGVGGLVMLALREPRALLELAHPGAIIEGMKTGVFPDEIKNALGPDVVLKLPPADILKSNLRKGVYEENPDYITLLENEVPEVVTDRIMAMRAAKTLGQWWAQSKARAGIVSTAQHINNIENTWTDLYRGAIYLDQMKHGATNEAALVHVNKALIDVDNLTPFERTTIREIFPFWTFTKHILRYVLTYPADHPVRASILAHLAQNMEETNTSGDPGRLAKLLFLGTPDASGKVNTVDLSNLNPFRSMSSVFTLTGFLQGLAPEYQTAMEAFGLDPLSGTPSLHPNFSYDAYAGTNLPTRPHLNPLDWAKAYIPQLELFDHFLLFTDAMREMKMKNPEAYKRSLWQELNMPFAIAPINIYDIRAKAAAAQYRDSATVVTDAMITGDTGKLRQFVAVPFQGYLYPGDQVANYIDNWAKIYPMIAPKAIIPKQKVKKRKGQL